MKIAAIVPAAGKGRRFKSSIPKPYIKLGDKPVLAHTLLALSKNKNIGEIFVAVEKNMAKEVRRWVIDKYKIKKTKVVIGGRERGDSVYNALGEIPPDVDYILIHDGIRPFITDELINESLAAARRFGAAVVAVPVKSTLKYIGRGRWRPPPTGKFSDKGKFIERTPDRNNFWEAQTPQSFKRRLIEKAYKRARRKNIRATDDAMLVEQLGVKPKIVMGAYSNIKITTREDLELAKILIRSRS